MISLNKFVQDELGSTMRRKTLIQDLWAGYGEIVRLKLKDGRSVIIKFVSPPQDNGSVSHERKVKSYAVEHAFYKVYAPLLDECRVARLIASREMDDERHLVLEDLDEAGFACRHDTLDAIDDVKPLVTWLAHFHKCFMLSRREEISEKIKNNTFELWHQGTYWYLDTRLEEFQQLKANDPLKTFARSIDDCLKSAKHMTLVHGDAKINNFCFSGDDSNGVAAVDFQYVGLGIGVRDLAYLLGSCLNDDKLNEFADELLDYYFAQLGAAPDVEREWRMLWPFCFADFERFLAGWSNRQKKHTGYTKQMLDETIQALSYLQSRRRAR